MGKQSLTKSTTKKKTTTAKKSDTKKKQAKASTAKSSEKPKKAPKKSTPAKKIKAPAAKKSTKPKKPAKPVERKPVSIPDLLKLKFDTWKPQKPFSAAADESYIKGFSAPPFIESSDPQAVEQLKALLLKTIDLKVVEVKEPPARKKDEGKVEKEVSTPAEKAPAAQEPQKDTSPAPKEEIKETKIEEPAPPEKPPVITAQPPVETKTEKPKPAAPPPPPQSVERDAGIYKPVLPVEATPAEPPDKGLKLLIGFIAVIFGILMIASSIHSGKYYITQSDSSLNVWKGRFSPTGKKLVMAIPGARLPHPAKSVYTKEEAMRPIFNYYMKQADKVSAAAAKGTPDFKTIKSNLNKALKVAPTQTEREKALERINSINFMSLLYKANEAARKKSAQGIEKALAILNQAKSLNLTKAQQQLLDKKISGLTAARKALKNR